MLSKINRLLILFLCVGLALYFVILNRATTTLFLAPGKSVEGNTGVVLIAVFGLGILCAAIVALFFGVKAHLRERKLKSKDRQREDFLSGILKARAAGATESWNDALSQWQKILKKDPTNIIAQLEISRCLEGLGEIREALKAIDSARSADPTNTEVLFRAAELNLQLQNKTAAVDNLALILYHQPNAKAAAMARDLSEQLGRVQDALEYQERLEQFQQNEKVREGRVRLEFLKLRADYQEDQDALRDNVKKFCKRHPSYAPALVALAKLFEDAGRIEEAAERYVQAAKSGSDPSAWKKAVHLWLSQGFPDRALAAAKNAFQEAEGAEKVLACIRLIRLYIELNMSEEAWNALQDHEKLFAASTEEQCFLKEYWVLKGLCLNQMGKHSEATRTWNTLLAEENGSPTIELKSSDPERPQQLAQPSPILSTP